jgi:hypothetical protein
MILLCYLSLKIPDDLEQATLEFVKHMTILSRHH